MEDGAVLKVQQPETGRPFPSRGFYFGLLALAVMGLWALGGAFSPATMVLSLLIVYAAGALRILREHAKNLASLDMNQDDPNFAEPFKLSTKMTRYSVLFILPSGVLTILVIGIVVLVTSNASYQ